MIYKETSNIFTVLIIISQHYFSIFFCAFFISDFRHIKPIVYVDVKSKGGISRGVRGGNGARHKACSSDLISLLELTETA